MTKITKIITTSLLGLTLLTVSSSACFKGDKLSNKGLKTYKNKIATSCKMDSEDFAGFHTQEEWKTFKDSGMFVIELNDICESNISLSDKEVTSVFKYVYKWAADSGKITSEEG